MFDSSTGDLGDLSLVGCTVGEEVDYHGRWQSPPMVPLPSGDPSTNPAPDAIVNGGMNDTQYLPPMRPYSVYTHVADQKYVYQCACANNNDPIPMSGPISIYRQIIQNPDGTFTYVVAKSGVASTIDPLP